MSAPTPATEPPVRSLLDALLTEAGVILAAIALAWFGIRRLIGRLGPAPR